MAKISNPEKKPRPPKTIDLVDPYARQPKILVDGVTIVFPKGWTKKHRDDWRKAFTRKD